MFNESKRFWLTFRSSLCNTIHTHDFFSLPHLMLAVFALLFFLITQNRGERRNYMFLSEQ